MAEESSNSNPSRVYPLLVHWSHGGDHPDVPAGAFSLPDRKTHDGVVGLVPGTLTSSAFFETPQGLVLVLAPAATFLLDPCGGGSTVDLPLLDENELAAAEQCCKCVLSDDAAYPGCGVLLVDLQSPVMWFCRVGGERWSRHDYDIGYYDLPEDWQPTKRNLFDIAGVGGSFYFCEGNDYKLRTLDFTVGGSGDTEEETPEAVLGAVAVVPPINLFPVTDSPCCIVATYLVESRRDLFLVAVVFLGFRADGPPHQFTVYRMDLSSEPAAWRRTADIGDRAFVLGDYNFGASCSASGCGVRPNCIYWFNCFSDEHSNLHVLSIDDGSVETVQTFDHAGGVHKKPFWLVPVNNTTG